jgi:hypothetical protein
LGEAAGIRKDLKSALQRVGDAANELREEKGMRAVLETELEAKVKGYEVLEAKVKGYEVLGGGFGESLDGLEGSVRRLESWCLDMEDAVRAVRRPPSTRAVEMSVDQRDGQALSPNRSPRW